MARRKSQKIRRRASEALDDDDRISRLPDGVIHHILSFIDTRFVIQTSALSRSWLDTWKSHPQLNTEITRSPNRANSSKVPDFVHRFLSRRDDVTELSTVNIRSNSISLPLLREIIIYAMSHKTQKLKIDFSGDKQTRRGDLDSSLFRSRHLEQLVLNIEFGLNISPSLTWDLPSLTTLSVNCATFTLNDASKSIDLFSQFPNLKNLSLEECLLCKIDTFIITSSELETMSLINLLFLNCKFVVSAPKLSSFTYDGMPRFSLSAKDLVSLKTVKFQTIYHGFFHQEPEVIHLMINNFSQLCNAENLTLNLDILKVLSVFPELRERRNCPFTSLQSLTLVSRELPLPATVFDGVINYFICSSPKLKLHIEHDPTPPRILFW